MLDAWLNHPGVQSVVAPALVAGILAALLRRPRLSGLALIGGTLVCIELAIGLELTPLNATRRIVLIALVAAAAGVALDLTRVLHRLPHWPAAVAAALALGRTGEGRGAGAVVVLRIFRLARLASAEREALRGEHEQRAGAWSQARGGDFQRGRRPNEQTARQENRGPPTATARPHSVRGTQSRLQGLSLAREVPSRRWTG